MSKLIKNMLTEDLKTRLADVGEVIVVSLGKLDAIQTSTLRQTLRKKRISLQMVKNSLARRAMQGTPLAPAFEKAEGMLAIAWGGEDVVDLAKELDRLSGVKEFEGLECRGARLMAPASRRPTSNGWPNGRRGPNNSRSCPGRSCRSGPRFPARSCRRAAPWPASSSPGRKIWKRQGRARLPPPDASKRRRRSDFFGRVFTRRRFVV